MSSDPTPEERLAAEAVTRLLAAADAVGRSLQRTFAPHDLTGPQYNVLRILRGAGEPLPTMELAQRMLQKTPGVTGLLDRLQAKGLVERERSSEDRRIWLCTVTAKGLELLDELERPVRRANVEAVRDASRAELEALLPVLERIRAPHEEAE